MRKFNIKLGFSVFALALMLAGMVALPASAAYVPLIEETSTQTLDAYDNGHTYLYKDGSFDWPGASFLDHNEDVDITSYAYESGGWSSDMDSLRGPAERAYPVYSMNAINQGWLGNTSLLPVFFDLANTTSDPLSIGFENKRDVFLIDDGAFTSVMLEPGLPQYGVFNITDEEFIHLTLVSHQDSADLMAYVADPQGRLMTMCGLSGGNIDVFPFRPSGPGMYFIMFSVMSSNDNLCTFDIKLESVVPEVIPFGGSVEGVLPGSEYLSESTGGSLVFQETAPSAFTYKFTANSTYPGRIRQSINMPELDNDVYDWYWPWMHITSDTFIGGVFPMRYEDVLSYDSAPFYYQSFQNDSYYYTVIGMENVEYSIYHDLPVVNDLPVNQEFYLENTDSDEQTVAYTLHLSQDSVLKLNSTTGSYGYDWAVQTVTDDMMYLYQSINDYSNFEDATVYYLPAGEYLVTAYGDEIDSAGFYEFNLGPIVEGVGSVAVEDGQLVGVRFPTSALSWYNISVMFNTHDNITVGTDVEIFNTFGGSVFDVDMDFGNQQSGVIWEEFPTNYTSWLLNTFSDGFGIAVISPHTIENNTAGLPGDEYHEYSLDYTVNVEDGLPWKFNDTAVASVASSQISSNFTLGDPGNTYECYLVSLTAAEGTWLNVSIFVEDVVNWNCTIYQTVGSWTQSLPWSDLEDTFNGDYDNESAFQFGSFGDRISMVFCIERTGSDVGRFDIVIDPLLTNSYEDMPPLTYPGESAGGGFVPAPDMGLVLGGVGVAVIVVVVVVVVLKKKATAA